MMTMKHGDQVSNDKELSWRQTDATSSNPRLNGRGFHLRIREQSVLVLWCSFGFVAREGGIEGGCFIVGDERSHMLGVRANAWLGVDPQLTQRSDSVAPRAL